MVTVAPVSPGGKSNDARQFSRNFISALGDLFGVEPRTAVKTARAVKEIVAIARTAKTAEAAETETLARIHEARPLADVDGFAFDGHRDELHDMLHDIVRVNWMTKRLDAADWHPEEIEFWVPVKGHPAGNDCRETETVLCTPGAVMVEGGRRVVRYQLAIVAE